MFYTIRRLANFDAVFKRLARKAKRLGLAEPTYRVLKERVEQADVFEEYESTGPSDGFGSVKYRKIGTEPVTVHDIEITGLDPIRYNGWQFLAVVETFPTGNLFFTAQPGEIPERYRTSGCNCEHCGLKRNRSETYLVKHESGEVKQIGSTCLQDFVGDVTAARLADIFMFTGQVYIELENMRESELTGWTGGSDLRPVFDTLTKSIAIQRQHGWVSRSKAEERHLIPTSDRVLTTRDIEVLPEDEENATAAISYFASTPVTPDSSELQRNLCTICSSGWHSKRSFGLACAIWVCYQFEVRKKAEAERLEYLRQSSQYLWQPKQRVKGIVATIVRIHTFDTQFGTSTLTVLEDENANVLLAKDLGFDEGQKVKFTATVKEHSEYKGVRQTSLIRAKDVQLAA